MNTVKMQRRQPAPTAAPSDAGRPVEPVDAERAARVEAAARVADRLSIRSVSLVAFSADSGRDPFAPLPRQVSTDVGFTKPRVLRGQQHVAFRTTLSFQLKAVGGAQSSIASLRATAQLVYAVKPKAKLSETNLDAFGELNAPFNAWPYWREFVQSALLRLGLPALTLPLYRVHQVGELMHGEEG